MKTLTVGLVPAPQLPTKIVYKISESLKENLQEAFGDGVSWEVKVEVDRLTGAADTVKEILNQAMEIKQKNEWDYAISLTDLPVFHEKFVVIADANIEGKTAIISLPAYGLTPTAKKVKLTLLHMIKELYYRNDPEEKDIALIQAGIGVKGKDSSPNFFEKLQKAFRFSKIKRLEFPDKDVSVRFIVKPKWSGLPIILSGMTIANEPWMVMPSFKKVVGLAFATGSYMLIFTTLWELSSLYSLLRLILVMSFAIVGMTAWTIITHNLWEKRDKNHRNKFRFIYNASTVLTLLTSVIIFYIFLYVLFLGAVTIFVPPDMFEKAVDHEVGPIDYLALVWLITSAATIAGAIGAVFENPDMIRKSTYSYRQYIRSKAIEEQNKAKEKYTDKETSNK